MTTPTDPPAVTFAPVRLAATDRGTGPVVVLLHAYPLDRGMFDALAADLAGSCRAIAVDLRGFGDSPLGTDATAADLAAGTPRDADKPCLPATPPGGSTRSATGLAARPSVLPGVPTVATGLTMRLMADDVVATLDHLGVAGPVDWLGVSMGGYVALEVLARHRSRVRSLLLCDTRATADGPEARAGRAEQAGRVLERGSGHAADVMPAKLLGATTRAKRPEAVARLRERIAAQDPRTLALAQRGMAARSDHAALVAAAGVPVLTLVGAEDGLTPPAAMAALAASVPGAHPVELSGVGHLAVWEDSPAAVAAIRDFLASPAGRASV